MMTANHDAAIHEFMHGRTIKDVIDILQQKGQNKAIAKKTALEAFYVYAQLQCKKGRRWVLFGIVLFLIGFIVAMISYSVSNSSMRVMFGALLGGGVMAIRGMILLYQNNKENTEQRMNSLL